MKRLRLLFLALLVSGILLSACGRRTPTPEPIRPAKRPTATARVDQAQGPSVTAAPNAGETRAPADASAAATPNGKVTITYWEEAADDDDVVLDHLASSFQKANPNIRVERAHLGTEDLRDQFQATSLIGEGPTLARAPSDFAGPFSELQSIQPIDSVLDQTFLDQFLPGALDAAVVKGALWGVPDNYGNHLMLLYNKALVTEPVPDNTSAWIEQLKRLTDAKSGTYGLVYNLSEPFWLTPWIGGFGGWPLDDGDQPDLDSPAVVAALQFAADLKNTHRVVPPEANYSTADAMFKQGKAAYLINGDWSLSEYQDAKMDLGIATLPRVSKTGRYPSPMTSGTYWFFSKRVSGAELEAARKFVQYMTSPAAQREWLERGSLPSSQEVAGDPKITGDPLLAASMAQLAHGRGLPAAAQMRCALDAMRPGLENVLASKVKPADAAEAMQAAAEQCVAEMIAKTTGD